MKARLPVSQPLWVKEFKSFIMRGNVVDLAVGIVIGAAFTGIVNSLVQDLINPVIGLLIGGVDFSNVFVVLSGQRGPSLEATRQSGAAVLALGQFINAIIRFMIVAMAIFWLLRVLTKLHIRQKEEAKPSGPTPQEKLLAEIRDLLREGREPAGPAVPPPPAAPPTAPSTAPSTGPGPAPLPPR